MAGVEELPPQPFAYMPLVAGGAALPYNLRDAEGRPIDGVRLTGPLVAQMFTGQIHTWRDPAILAAQADNVAARLPDLPVRRVVRSEQSGTTAVFMQYMAAVAPDDMQALRNRFTLPTPRNVAVALLAATQNPDGTQDSPRCSRASVPRPIPSRRTAMRSCRRRA